MQGARFAAGPLRGVVTVPGDKSISHRALILGAAAKGTTRITGPNHGADVMATLDAVAALGAVVRNEGDAVVVSGGALQDPPQTIDARNSGTTARLLIGLCAGSGITARFDGDASLRRRPMERVARPLRALGATVQTTGGHLPVSVRGVDEPCGGTYALELPSAQLKSALLLANLRARGDVHITGDAQSRDHTERMLRHFGREVEFDGSAVMLKPGNLRAADVHVPGDLSAAAFFLVGAIVAPESDIVLRAVGVNPTRTGILDALLAMGANITLANERDIDGEPVADLRAGSSHLKAIEIPEQLVVRAIDEIPVLAVAAAFAAGTTHIRGAGELRSKESDRIAALASLLRACNVAVVERSDGLDITGGGVETPNRPLQTFGDHRIAMAVAVLAAAAGAIGVDNVDCIAISFPAFTALWRESQSVAAPR